MNTCAYTHKHINCFIFNTNEPLQHEKTYTDAEFEW